MRVLTVSWYDNADQMHLTARALREKLGWEATSIALKGKTYLGYSPDWVLGKNVESEEVMDYAEGADFFIFQDLIHATPELDLRPLINNKNTCIAATGSNARNRIDSLHVQQIRTDMPVVTALHDYTIANSLYPAPFDCTIVDTRSIDKLVVGVEKYDEFSVIHAPTNQAVKGTEIIREVMTRFGDDVIYTEISGRSWEDCIREKAKHLVTIDQLLIPAYGLNSLESLALGHQVISNISPWCYAHLPDLPIESVYPCDEKIADRLYNAVSSLKELYDNGRLYWSSENENFVRENFGMYNMSRRWKHYIDFVKSGENIR